MFERLKKSNKDSSGKMNNAEGDKEEIMGVSENNQKNNNGNSERIKEPKVEKTDLDEKEKELKGDLKTDNDIEKTSEEQSSDVKPGDDSPENDIESLKKEIETLKDLLQRRQADFDNYKKRVIKNREDDRKRSIRDIALDIINTNDDLLRGLEAASNSMNGESLEKVNESLVEGVKIISKQLEDTLSKYGIVEIDSLEQDFNPNYHEAVEIEISRDVTCDKVTKIYQKGFRIDDFVVRTAKVRVTKPEREQAEAGEVNSADDEHIE